MIGDIMKKVGLLLLIILIIGSLLYLNYNPQKQVNIGENKFNVPAEYDVDANNSTSVSLSSKGNVITVNIIDETDINNSVMEYQKEFEGKYNFSKRNYQTEHNNSIIHTTVIKDNNVQINRFYFRKNNTSYLIQTGDLNQEKEKVINNIIDSL